MGRLIKPEHEKTGHSLQNGRSKFRVIYVSGAKPPIDLCKRDVCRGLAAVTACFDVESHFLVVGQTCEASALNS